jgi:hypothetical protein
LVRYSAGANANILWSAGVRDRSEVSAAIERLQAAGMPTIDISGMESARVSAVVLQAVVVSWTLQQFVGKCVVLVCRCHVVPSSSV